MARAHQPSKLSTVNIHTAAKRLRLVLGMATLFGTLYTANQKFAPGFNQPY